MDVAYIASVRGARAMATAQIAINRPYRAYEVLRSIRSLPYPPTRQPIAQTTPVRAPVTRATVSALACQSSATADHRLDAAPVPIGRKQMSKARIPVRDLATLQRSRNTASSVRP